MLKKTVSGILLLAAVLAVVGGGCSYDNLAEMYPNADCDPTTVSFADDIEPILKTSCSSLSAACHGPGNTSPAFLDDYDGVKEQVDNGKLLSSIIWDGNASFMPSGSSSKIEDCSINKITAWIAAGAPNN